MHYAIKAYQAHKAEATQAYAAFADLCGGNPPPRVPGCDTVIRLAVRIEAGHSIEVAAAREYLYRWKLRLWPDPDGQDTFGAPHLIGL